MLDEYIWGEVRRVSPEASVPVVELRRQTCVSGGEVNAAPNVASLSGWVLLGSVVGEDIRARLLREVLSRCSVEGGVSLTVPDHPATTRTSIIAHNQQVIRVDREERKLLSLKLKQWPLAAGATLEQAAQLVKAAPGIVVEKVGTATVSLGELHATLSNGGDHALPNCE